MSTAHLSAAQYDSPGLYEIRIKGHLDERWAGWFEAMTITHTNNGETLLRGLVADQSALYGLLRKVRDLGLPLISVIPIRSPDGADVDANPDQNRMQQETNP
ncbi:MAG TPA: hypothetical protein PKA05_18450 [Roseiflexaceae bacterium]|nr:hypothetical protein [Roseiflexaceae bacterium]HMP42365.1 hypothetical protein [Roseiflexaceae bacterium]